MASDSLTIDMEGILGAIQKPAETPPSPAASPPPAQTTTPPAGEKPLKPMFDYGEDWKKNFGG